MLKNIYLRSISEPPKNQHPESSPQYANGRFIGDGVTLNMGLKDYAVTIRDTVFKKNDQVPNSPLPCCRVDSSIFKSVKKDKFSSTWLGHSSLILQMGGYRIFIDPVFEDKITPMKLARFHKEIPINIRDIPDVDVVVISHDNFDHLDRFSIEILAPVTKIFIVPLGIGNYMKVWGVDPDKIIELDWWQRYSLDGNLSFTSTPARHFSGRGLFTRNKTLWSSWVIECRDIRLYFSGDSGYFNGFREIGETLGPFDLTYMQCGAYYRAWRNIQMTPEETVQAHLDLNGNIFHPIHWGTFNMSFHAWYEPIQRLTKEANRRQITLATPIAGETIHPFEGELGSNWWSPVLGK